ncbi:helix-turn-helix transcriptional regulator [Pseudonocardia sp.]|uniref:PadR family transcriptional regulator n=1 Tax=Pseudonocardia sp. TaxID=60912 RepID=UPI0025FE3E13|nr:helix-turn-helix transcriptional regulator [Pseudonocardia sp.]
MTRPPRMTVQTEAVLAALLEHGGELWGFELSRLSGLAAGTIYPILQRLAAAGWVVSRWEDQSDAEAGGRPARRYHQLTVEGRSRAVHALEATAARRSDLSRLLGLRPDTDAAPS